MKNILTLFLGFLLSCLFFTGCKKNVYEEMKRNLEGKWELSSVNYWVLYGESYPAIDYPKTAIYEFQKNGRLVITYVTSEGLQKKEYGYQCFPFNEKEDGTSIHLQIADAGCFRCTVTPEYKTLKASMLLDHIGKRGQAIDDVDLIMMELDYVGGWSKYFVKLK